MKLETHMGKLTFVANAKQNALEFLLFKNENKQEKKKRNEWKGKKGIASS